MRLAKRAIFTNVVVPVVYGYDFTSALTLACAIADCQNIQIIGLVPVAENQALSGAAVTARRLRTQIKKLAERFNIQNLPHVFVSSSSWNELKNRISREQPDLLVMEWPLVNESLGAPVNDILRELPCNTILFRGPILEKPKSVLVSLRGGLHAELALRLALSLSKTSRSKVTSLHIQTGEPGQAEEAAYRGLQKVLENLPEVEKIETRTDDPASVILHASANHDLLIIGATAQRGPLSPPLGKVAEKILQLSPAGVVIVKTAGKRHPEVYDELSGSSAISVLVDKWFAENTYHANEFSDLAELVRQKVSQNLTISLALPALNEEATVGKVIEVLKNETMQQYPLLDEIVLIDSKSTDRTREIAAGLGIPVYVHQQILPEYGARIGKGEALWKSLLVTRGDIILWIDTDITNIHPRFIYGLVGPLLHDPHLLFIKGFYRRPLRVGDKLQVGGGGRVTELTARPLINLFFPELSGIVQPLSGEYGGRRSALERLPFFSGYGVEIGLLIDIYERFGLHSIAQVDLQERIHHNQSLEALSKMSFAIIQAVSRKIERRFERSILEEVNKTMKLIRYSPGRLYLEVEEIAELERPAMIDCATYREKRHS